MTTLVKRYRELIILFLLLYLSILFQAYLLNVFYPLPGDFSSSLFVGEILGREGKLSFIWTMALGLINMSLIYWIVEKVADRQTAKISTLLYAVSPWTAYLQISGSVHVVALFGLLLLTAGTILLKRGRWGLVVMGVATVVLLYVSVLLWPVVFLLIFLLYKNNLFPRDQKIYYLLVVLLICLPIALLSIMNTEGLKNILKLNITIYSDPGLLNTVNVLRGESQEVGIGYLAKFVENKYIYFIQHLVYSVTVHFTPVTYFTSQAKLLNFSFTPPILLGFIIPFLISVISQIQQNKRHLFIFLILILPSALAQNTPDPARLLLISPLFFFLIADGLVKMTGQISGQNIHQKYLYRCLLFLTIVLVVIQSLVILTDIYLRETVRMVLSIPV